MGLQEAKVEKKLVEAVESRGGLCLKFVSPGMNGVPDRLILYPHGVAFFVEVKAPGQKPRKLQLKVAEWFEGMGHPVFVVDTERDAVVLADGLAAGDLEPMADLYGAERYR